MVTLASFAAEFALGRYRVFGLDISQSFVQIAAAHAKDTGVAVEFRHGDAAFSRCRAEGVGSILKPSGIASEIVGRDDFAAGPRDQSGQDLDAHAVS